MVYQAPKERMTDYDWRVCGHDTEESPFPGRRLNVPIPDNVGGLHELAHLFAGLSEELHRIARMPLPVRSAVTEAMGLLKYENQRLQKIRQDWISELHELRSSKQPKQGDSRNPDSPGVVRLAK